MGAHRDAMGNALPSSRVRQALAVTSTPAGQTLPGLVVNLPTQIIIALLHATAPAVKRPSRSTFRAGTIESREAGTVGLSTLVKSD